jgi:phosphoserine phosphatase RsbX
METVRMPMVEYGVAEFVLPGQGESGDQHLVCCNRSGILVAAIDGIGHGEAAASASKAAAEVLRSFADEPTISLVERCHDRLRATRGVVLSLAFIDPAQRMMTWLGVGNVQGVLVRANVRNGNGQESLLLRAGVVGSQLPALQGAVLPIAQGDTLFLATDGVRSDFSMSLSAWENPQKAADRILERHGSRTDDALVLVVRLTGIGV